MLATRTTCPALPGREGSGALGMRFWRPDAFGNALGSSLVDQITEVGLPPPASTEEKASIVSMFEGGQTGDSPPSRDWFAGMNLRLREEGNGLRLGGGASPIDDTQRVVRDFDPEGHWDPDGLVPVGGDGELLADARKATSPNQPTRQQQVKDEVDAIYRRTRPTDAQRQADPKYGLVVESNLRNSQYSLATSGSPQDMGDPDVRWAQAMGYFGEAAESKIPSVAPGSLIGTSLAFKAWQSDFELKLGGALYTGLGGNAELTLAFNPARLDLSATEFEWGIGVGFGAKVKAGWNALDDGGGSVAAPLTVWKRFGDGQADGTGAISLKGGFELSVPGANFVLGEGRIGWQSPLSGAPAGTPAGGFYEVKLGEAKVAPTLQLGGTFKFDVFNSSFKRTKP